MSRKRLSIGVPGINKIFLHAVWILIILCVSGFSFADARTFSKEYVYQAQKADNEISCRVIAHERVKINLLGDLVTYLKKETDVKYVWITHPHLTALTAGIVGTEIMEERWNGKNCFIRANLVADFKKIVKAIDLISQDRRKTRELIGIRERAENLLKQIEQTAHPLTRSDLPGKKLNPHDYYGLIKGLMAIDWFEKGYSSGVAGYFGDAMNAFDKALELYPDFAEAHYNRGYAFMMRGDLPQAIRDYERALVLDPDNERAHYDCGHTLAKLGKYQDAIRHFDKVIILNPESELAFFHRGLAHARIGSYYQALRDCDMALDLILLKESHWTGH